MLTELSQNDIHVITTEASRVARRLARRLHLPACDLEDLAQDLLVDLLRRLPRYDPNRATLGAFAGLVMRHQSLRIAAREMGKRQDRGGDIWSLDMVVDGHPLADCISAEDGLSAHFGACVPAREATILRMAVLSALSHLTREDQALCRQLLDQPVSMLVAAGFGSRSGLYRRMAELRPILTAYGLGPSWGDLVAA